MAQPQRRTRIACHSPVTVQRDGIRPPPPRFDAIGLRFGQSRQFFVPVVRWIAFVLAIELVSFAGIAMALRSQSSAKVGSSLFAESEVSPQNPSTSMASATEEAARPTDAVPDDEVKSNPEPVETDPSAAESTSLPSSSPSGVTAPAPFDQLRRANHCIALPTSVTNSPQLLFELPATDVTMQLVGGNPVSPTSSLRLVPMAGVEHSRTWQVKSIDISNHEDPVGEFVWKDGRLSFSWSADPLASLRSCGLEIVAKTGVQDVTEFCALCVPAEVPAKQLNISDPTCSIGLGLSESITMPTSAWRLTCRLAGSQNSDTEAIPVLEPGQKATLHIRDPDDPKISLVEIDLTFKAENSRPSAHLAYFTSFPAGDIKVESQDRRPLSRRTWPAIIAKERTQVQLRKEEVKKLEQQIEREEARPSATLENKRVERLQERLDSLEQRADYDDLIDDWEQKVSQALSLLEKKLKLELNFAMAHSSSLGERVVVLASTPGFNLPEH